jgi:Tol biopolymer transport system component
VSKEHGGDDIWVINADGSNPVNLTRNDWEWDKHPSWSPDGTQLAFWSNRYGFAQIFVMDANGRNLYAIPSAEWEEYDPIWIKGGGAAAGPGSGMVSADQAPARVWRVGLPTRVSTPPPPPQIRSFGGKIAFVTGSRDYPELWIMDPSGGSRECLGPWAPYSPEYRELREQERFSPDGQFYAGVATAGEGEVQIFIFGPPPP